MDQPINPPTIDCARAVRNGGIDAMAALDSALHAALLGLSAEQAHELKRAFGKVMGEISSELISPSIRAFPELDPDGATWAAVARDRAGQRFIQLGGCQPAGTQAARDN